uniref:Uncharacterized protein n=1 Tax=Anguilla anguilla TaxID=7936 RepID=A0A0E9PGS2_ANGAN
MISGARRIRG